MFVKRLKLENFRGLTRLDLAFAKSPLTVLVGTNGVGKTTVLEAVALMLRPIGGHFLGPSDASATPRLEDLRNGTIDMKLELTATILGDITWGLQVQRRGSTLTSPAWSNKELLSSLEDLDSRLGNRPESEIPIAVYYPTDRAVLDIPLRIRKRHAFHQFEAWEGALDEGDTRFRMFFEWFRDREDIENEQRARGMIDQDPQLSAVREAVTALLPGYHDLKVQRLGLRMTLKKPDGVEVSVDQLSDGEKGLLALGGDLARRLSIAGAASSAKDVHGVALIDEIELHLHPKWQREVIPALLRAFPGCQFIVTTHSPQVLSDVRPEQILVLHRDAAGVRVERALATNGKDSNALLQEVFGDPGRSPRMAAELSKLRNAIDRREYAGAREILAKVSASLGQDDPSVASLTWDLRDAELSNETDSQGR
jgi:predicted ATP-binding protein involved in virulence